MWSDAHKWVAIPYTKSERRREDAVREPCYTAIEFPKKYFDIDTGKFIKDKLSTIESCPLYDIFSEDPYGNGNWDRHHFYRHWRSNQRHYELQIKSNIVEKPKFVPKDIYFDDDFEPESEKCSEEEYQAKVEEAEVRIREHYRHTEHTKHTRSVGYIVANTWIRK
jgi:hypothetical protein